MESETVTQPRVSDILQETSNVPGETDEVMPKDYRAALLRDLPGATSDGGPAQKRSYKKCGSEIRNEIVTTRSGRLSRPAVRF